MSQVYALMREYDGDVPGSSLLVIRDGQPLVRRANGLDHVDAGNPEKPATNYLLAAVTNQLPLDGCCMGGTVHVEGRPPGDDVRRVSFLVVTPSFLPAMGMPLRAGRFLTEADTSEDVLFAVVNQAAVNRYWPDRNPVGAFGRLNRPDGNRFQVVGVVVRMYLSGV